MNATVNDVGSCKKLLRVELTAAEVDAKHAEVEESFEKHANLPGFRKGKAPKEMVLKSFAREIREEAQQKLVAESYRDAIKEREFKVYGLVDLEEPHLERGKPMAYTATLEVFPQFDLPAYRGLPAKRENRQVSDSDIDKAIELLRGRHATFLMVDRAAQAGDIAVVNYAGTCDGKPIAEIAPDSRGLAGQRNYWVELQPGAFLPGFAEQLYGAVAGEKRAVNVEFPADFPSQPLAGKRAVYEVEVVEIKERLLPPLDDAFARSWEATTMKGLREGVRQDLQNELNEKLARSVREQVVAALVNPLKFEMPETAVLAETRHVVYEIVRDNQQRGLSKEAIDKNKDEIYNLAQAVARERVKAAFVFRRIAEQEGLKVTQEEFDARVFSMAKSMKMPPDKLVKELEKRNGTDQIAEQILNEKVIDFLQQHARVEDVPAPANPA